MTRLGVHRGDITRLAVDAIVNAANERMLGGGGVDGAIHRAAGAELLWACRRVPEVSPGVRCPTGQARITPGFNLPATYVIHTVGPVFQGGHAGEDGVLAESYRASLELAGRHGVSSIAFPAVSCGVFGYPPGRAAGVAVGAVRKYLASDTVLERVLLVAVDDEVHDALLSAVAKPE